jgi:hypothetical protein
MTLCLYVAELLCATPQAYERCGNTSARTCYDISTTSHVMASCLEGCFCPQGQSLNSQGVCVDIAVCSCIDEGIEYDVGATITRTTGTTVEDW